MLFVILTHHKGMMAGCKVITVEETRTRVHVFDEKRPKWVMHNDPKWKLTNTTDEAMIWLGVDPEE